MRDVLQSTARKFKIYMADSAAPTTGKTGLSSFTVYLAKDSAAESTVAPTITERGHGWYEVTPSTSHRDTLGESAWTFVATGAIDFVMKETVVLYDAQLAAVGANTTAPATPTNVTAARDVIAAYIDTEVAAIKAKTDNLPSDPADASDIAAAFASLASSLATLATYVDTEIAAIKAKTDNLPSDPADQSAVEAAITAATSPLATAAALTIVDDFLDTEIAAIKVVTDKLGTTVVLDGSDYQFTANALELGPSGGGGGGTTDWTADERTAIRAILGIPGSGTTPADPSTGILDTIRDQTVAIAAALSAEPAEVVDPVHDGGELILYCDADYRVRSGTQLDAPVADPAGGLLAKLTAIGVGNLIFGASRTGLPAGAISGTVATLAASGSGASQLLVITIEITAAGSGLRPSEDFLWQIWQQQTQGSEVDSFPEVSGDLRLRIRTAAL